jgi:hypothetical protein
MDDLQFRRSIYSDPNSQDVELLAAIQESPARQKQAKDIISLDERIKQAMQVPVPDDLCDKLILRQTFASHQQHKRKKRFHLAIAASVAVFGGLLVNYMQFSSAYDNLGDYSLAHVYHEESIHSNNSTNTVSLTSLNSKMATFEGSFKSTVGKLIFADYCRFGGMKSLHLVYQGETSPVNVFIVPKDDRVNFVDRFNDQTYYGETLGFKNANVIIVADGNESLNKWQQNVSQTINWNI